MHAAPFGSPIGVTFERYRAGIGPSWALVERERFVYNRSMNEGPTIAEAGALIGDPAP